MKNGRIIVAGIGPGSASDITPAVINALKASDVNQAIDKSIKHAATL